MKHTLGILVLAGAISYALMLVVFNLSHKFGKGMSLKAAAAIWLLFVLIIVAIMYVCDLV